MLQQIKEILEILKSTWGGNILFASLGLFFGWFFASNVDIKYSATEGLILSNYNSPHQLSRYLENITFPERHELKEVGYFEIGFLAEIHNKEKVEGIQCSEIEKYNDDDCDYYRLAENEFYTQISGSNYYHIKDGELPLGVNRVLVREDEAAIGLIRLFDSGKNPFGDAEFKVAFSEDLDFDEAVVCRDNRFWASNELSIRSASSRANNDSHIILNVNASEDCKNGSGIDACLKDVSQEEMEFYSQINDRTGKPLDNDRFIRISLEAAKELYPDKFDVNGNKLRSSDVLENGEPVTRDNILSPCELGYIHKEEI